MLENKVILNQDNIQLCLVEERQEGYPNEKKILTIPLEGEVPQISKYKGKVEKVWKPTFLDNLRLPSIGVEYAYEGQPMGNGITHSTYLIWVAERGKGEWLAISSQSDYQFPKRWEDVTYSGPFSLNDFYVTKLLEAYKIKPESTDAKAIPKTGPVRLEELAKAGNQ